MRILRLTLFASIALAAISSLRSPQKAEETKRTAEDVVARHLASIGSSEARIGVKSRVVQGTVQFKLLVGSAGILEGKEWLVSEGRKFQFMMKIPSSQYRGEQFICDGERTQVASSSAGERSIFGQFVHTQNMILREGLIGGALSTAWPPLNLGERKAKLTYEGLKKMEGRELHRIRYMPKKGRDVEVFLFFEPETFRHVLTTYTLTLAPQVASGDVQTARQQETRYELEERFSDFKTFDGLTLPTHWDMRFTAQMPVQGTGLGLQVRNSVLEWNITQEQITNNVSLDPRNFQIK